MILDLKLPLIRGIWVEPRSYRPWQNFCWRRIFFAMKEWNITGEDKNWQYTDGFTSLDMQVQRFLVRSSYACLNPDVSVGREIIQQDHISPTDITLKTDPKLAKELLEYMGYGMHLVFRDKSITLE